MTAGTLVTIALPTSLLLAVSCLALGRRLAARESLSRRAALGITLAGTVYSLVTTLPTSMAIARAAPFRAPSALLLLTPWTVGASLFLRFRRENRVSLPYALAFAFLAAAPVAILAMAGGTVGGAHRSVHECYGNLKALATATRDYVQAHKAWPSRADWVNELFPLVGQRSAFRCPARPDRAYVYQPPNPASSPDVPVFECVHTFVSQRVVVGPDLRVAIEHVTSQSSLRDAKSPSGARSY